MFDPITNTWVAGTQVISNHTHRDKNNYFQSNNKTTTGPVNTQAGQENIGIIWLGEAAVKASQGALRAGVHRVTYARTASPRLTAWYEVCTVDQANREILQGSYHFYFISFFFMFFLCIFFYRVFDF